MRVEREYSARGLPPMFQVASAYEPDDLATLLAARGYEAVTPTFVRVADPASVAGRLPDLGEVRIARDAPTGFATLVKSGSRSPEDGAERLEILARIAGPRVCVEATAAGTAVSCGMAAIAGGKVVINMMRTDPAHRRNGHARRVLAAIARWALEQDARQLFLSVEQENAAAIALYERVGFEPAYSYVYYRKGMPT
jgi:ribosomal protein S18 acetylase RimI-like enzyme